MTHGSDTLFTFLPDEGFEVYNVWVNGDSLGPMSQYLFENVTANQSIEVAFDVATNLPAIAETKNLASVFPNPVNNQLTVQINNELNAENPVELQFFDFTGKNILTLNQQQNLKRINLSDFPAGVYFLLISNNNKTDHQTFKIIKLE